MPRQISLKRFTNLKTTKVAPKNGLKNLCEYYRLAEITFIKLAKFARMSKVSIKKLDKLYKENEKRKEKNKLTKIYCEKERKLAEEINSVIGALDQLALQMGTACNNIDTRQILNDDNMLNTSWLHTMESDVYV